MGSGASTRHARHTESVSSSALKSPAFNILKNRRIVLASSSPRRLDLLASLGIHPEVIPSTFEENLPKSDFKGAAAYEYPVETGARKALEVYKRLLVSEGADWQEHGVLLLDGPSSGFWCSQLLCQHFIRCYRRQIPRIHPT